MKEAAGDVSRSWRVDSALLLAGQLSRGLGLGVEAHRSPSEIRIWRTL